MTETGNPDAPYRFTRIYAELGTESGYSITPVPGGVVALMNDDVYILSGSEIQAIGTKIRRTIFDEAVNLSHVIGSYDYDEREFALLVPTIDGTKIWRYSQRSSGWTVDQFPFELKWLAFTKSSLIGLTIDSSTGTIDDAGIESIDSEVGTAVRRGMFYANDTFVYNDDSSVVQDAVVDSSVEAITGLLAASSPLEKTIVTEIQVEYEMHGASKVSEPDVDQILEFDYRDGTGAWLSYESGVRITPTHGPQILSVRKTVIGHNLQFRLRSDTLGRLRILSFVPMVNVAQNEALG
jgi:hypothetical protein